MNLDSLHISNCRVLISPLNWGFGHVSRTIPLVKALLKNENSVFIACNNEQKQIYQQYFQTLEVNYLFLDGYPFQFNGKGNFALDLLKNSRSLSKHLKKEHIQTEIWVKELAVDIVISDHRYGFYSTQKISIFLTHQYNLPPAPFSFFANLLHHRLIKKFQEVWIPDNAFHQLAGDLSRCPISNTVYLGSLSRFENINIHVPKEKNTLLISGPKAYWNDLKHKFEKQLKDGTIEIIIGPENAQHLFKDYSITFVSSNDWILCDEALLATKTLYGYCGYTTIMDLEFLKCDAHLIPCKGQYEQAYLFNLHFNN